MSHPIPRSLLSALLLVALAASAARAATLYVANDGVDDPACGSKKSPCRSISQAVNTRAADGDSVVVGPGVYGDLNGNGTPGDAPGEEIGGFGCMLVIARRVALTSSSGAAATIIDGRFDALSCNVGIGADGTQFGKPGKGFTVTNTASATGSGIVINASNVQVRGNQVVATGMGPNTIGVGAGGPVTFHGRGIETVDKPQTMLIEGNQVIGWSIGIAPFGAGKTIRNNVVALNNNGIAEITGGAVTGNVVVVNAVGISLGLAANGVGNAVYGNLAWGLEFNAGPYTGTLEKNDFVANGFAAFSANPNCGIVGPGFQPSFAAANNYWGAATGPGADPADAACTGGTNGTAPFATKPFKVKTRIKP